MKNKEIIASQKTVIEGLKAENQYLKNKLKESHQNKSELLIKAGKVYVSFMMLDGFGSERLARAFEENNIIHIDTRLDICQVLIDEFNFTRFYLNPLMEEKYEYLRTHSSPLDYSSFLLTKQK